MPAFAEDELPAAENQPDENVVDLDTVKTNSTMITADQYLEMTVPLRRDAHREAQKLSEKEIKAMVDAQNYVNRRAAEKNNEEIPEEISIDATDKEAVEDFLIPKKLYTYDDIPQKLEYDDFK